MHQQPKKSSALKYVAIGCVAVLLLIVCAFGSCMVMGGGAAMFAVSAPADQTKGYFADLRAQNYQGALSRMSPMVRSMCPEASGWNVM